MTNNDNSEEPIRLPAVRGTQGHRLCYTTMLPIKLIEQVFPDPQEEAELPAEMRTQRVLNKSRIPRMVRYLLDNKEKYCFPAVTASFANGVQFQLLYEEAAAAGQEGAEEEGGPKPPKELRNLGVLEISPGTKLIVNDGQHRLAALAAAQKEKAGRLLSIDSIALTLYATPSPQEQRQIFSDINLNMVRPPRSVSYLFDGRNPVVNLAKETTQQPPLKGLVELEKNNLAPRSSKLYTLSAVVNTLSNFLQLDKNEAISPYHRETCLEFFGALAELFPAWKQVQQHTIAACELRQDYVYAHGVLLEALGYVGHELVKNHRDNWQEKFQILREQDWTRVGGFWEGRCMEGGRMAKSRRHVLWTAYVLNEKLGQPHPAEEAAAREEALAEFVQEIDKGLESYRNRTPASTPKRRKSLK